MPKYIDADALLKEAKRLSGPQTGDGWDNWGVYALIERQPAADVEPKRKTGRWIDLDDHLLCSSCGASHADPDKNYCSNCGARMMSDDEIADGIGQTFSPD